MHSKFWRIPELDLECIRVAHSNHFFPRHYHESYVIEVVECGRNEFWCDGKTYSARPHDIIIIHPGQMHTGYPAGPYRLSYRALYPSKNFMQDLCGQITGEAYAPQFSSNVIRDPALSKSFLKMHSDLEVMHNEPMEHSSVTFVIEELIVRHSLQTNRVIQRCASFPQARMKPALDFVSQKFNENVSISQLSTLCGFSEFHFVREFKKMTGSAPYEYVVARRIEESRKLLTGGMTIAEVAASTGFYDQSHFNRHFKRIVGITPGLYRSAAC